MARPSEDIEYDDPSLKEEEPIHNQQRVALEAGAKLWSEGQSRIENLLGKDVAAALLGNLRKI